MLILNETFRSYEEAGKDSEEEYMVENRNTDASYSVTTITTLQEDNYE